LTEEISILNIETKKAEPLRLCLLIINNRLLFISQTSFSKIPVPAIPLREEAWWRVRGLEQELGLKRSSLVHQIYLPFPNPDQ
jgi:hypothetical protein